MNIKNTSREGQAQAQTTARASRRKPKWQIHVVSFLFMITLLLVFGFFVQEGVRWLGN